MKIKKLLASLMAITFIGGAVTAAPQYAADYSLTASAAEEEYSDGVLTYKLYEDYAVVTGYEEGITVVEIPSEVEGLPVTAIGERVFMDCTSLTAVSFPDTLISIGDSAFERCSSLGSIAIPDSVKKIGDDTFAGCSNLTEVKLEDSITEIGHRTFAGCKSLKEIIIPEKVNRIGDSAFYECSSLTSITIPDSVTSIEGYAFGNTPWLENKKKNSPLVIVNNLLIDGTSCTGDVIIPDSVSSIEDRAFFFCGDLTSITIPASVTSIGPYAFFGCSNLTSVELSAGITRIEIAAFASCKNLEKITIPESVTYFGGSVFWKTKWLENKQKENPLVIVNDILIDGSTCTGEVVISYPIKYIADYAFECCYDLTSITIPDNISVIGEGMFSECASLEAIIIMNPNCEIYDNESTICNAYSYRGDYTIFDGTIYGYENSTAQAYAEKYGRNFKSLGEAPKEPEYKLGDPNVDGLIDAVDASYILGLYAKISTNSGEPTEFEWLTCDVNKDGYIDAVDASTVLAYYAYVSTDGEMSFEEFMNKAE